MPRFCPAVSIALWLALPLLAGAQSSKPPQAVAGKLLVASRKVTNARFRQTVVLLLRVTEKGAAGLVLNRPGSRPLAKVFPDVASAQARTDPAYWGGPVGDKQIFCLVQVSAPLREGQLVVPGVYVSSTPALMDLALNAGRGPDTFRVYLGYTGWAKGQLRRELAEGLWEVLPAPAPAIFDPDPATLWSRLIAQAEAGRRH